MFKKILLTMCLIMVTALSSNAGFDSFMDSFESVLDKADRVESATNRAQKYKKYIPKQNTQNYQQNNNNRNYSDNEPQYVPQAIPEYAQPQPYGQAYPQQQYNQNYQPQDIQYGQQYQQQQFYTGQAQTLGDLPDGTLVLDPNSVWNYRKGENYSGEIHVSYPVIWRKLTNNHYSQGSTLLLSEYEIADYPFCVKGKGIRDWSESDLRKFLNGYFYRHLSQGFKNELISTTIPYADLTGKPKTSTDNVFVLSIVEWDLSDRAHNGKAIEYIDMRSMYHSKRINAYNNNILETNDHRHGLHGSITRTINRPKATSAGHDEDVFTILGDGTLNTITNNYATNNYDFLVRPALNLKSTTKVKGPYKQRAVYWGSNDDFVYYVLDFDQTQASTATNQ